MGTKRKLYRPPSETRYEESVAQEQYEIEEQVDVGMQDLLIGAVIVIVIVLLAFLSPNF